MRFCQFCGTKLEDGAQCTCAEAQAAAAAQKAAAQAPIVLQPAVQDAEAQRAAAQEAAARQAAAAQEAAAQAAAVAQQAAAVAQEKAKAATKQMSGYLLSYFAAPAETVRGYMTRDGVSTGVMLTVLRLLAVGLALFGILHKACGSFVELADSEKLKISVPFFGSMLNGGLIALMGMGLFILGCFLIAKLRQSSLTLSGAWQYSALNSVLPTLLLLVSFPVSFLSIPAALVFIVLSVLASLVCGVLTAQLACEKTNSGLYWMLFLAVIAVIAVVMWMFAPKLIGSAIGGIEVTFNKVTMTITDILEEANQSFDWDSFWEEFTESMERDWDNLLYYIR